MIILGSGTLQRPDGDAIYALVQQIALNCQKSEHVKTFNLLHRVMNFIS